MSNRDSASLLGMAGLLALTMANLDPAPANISDVLACTNALNGLVNTSSSYYACEASVVHTLAKNTTARQLCLRHTNATVNKLLQKYMERYLCHQLLQRGYTISDYTVEVMNRPFAPYRRSDLLHSPLHTNLTTHGLITFLIFWDPR